MQQTVNENTLFIEKFEDIGMLDPIPTGIKGAAGGSKPQLASKPGGGSPSKKKENGNKPSLKVIEFSKHVYPESRMESMTRPPPMVYRPTTEIIRKMIKACIKVESSAEILAKF